MKVYSQQSKFIGIYHLYNDTLVIYSDSTFKLCINGLDSTFRLCSEIYTGRGTISGKTFKFSKFNQDENTIIFWMCRELRIRRNKLYGSKKCNPTASTLFKRYIFKRV